MVLRARAMVPEVITPGHPLNADIDHTAVTTVQTGTGNAHHAMKKGTEIGQEVGTESVTTDEMTSTMMIAIESGNVIDQEKVIVTENVNANASGSGKGEVQRELIPVE